MFSPRSLVLLGIAALSLAACGTTREDLGLGRNPPDEFAVVERAPLSMPPDFGLRPPRPGAPRPQTVDPAQQASESLFGAASSTAPTDASAGEKGLLAAAGATQADPHIRDTVDREASQEVVASPHLVDRLLSGDETRPVPVVDAAGEAARIKKDQDSGQPVTAGATPIIEKQQSGWLGL